MQHAADKSGSCKKHENTAPEGYGQCQKEVPRCPCASVVHDGKGLVDEAPVGISALLTFNDHWQRLARRDLGSAGHLDVHLRVAKHGHPRLPGGGSTHLIRCLYRRIRSATHVECHSTCRQVLEVCG